MTSTPDPVPADVRAALDQHRARAATPDPHRIHPDIVAQPVDGSGYVYGQVGWLADDGTAYGLNLPQAPIRAGTGVRPLYICLGRHSRPPGGPAPEDAVPAGEPCG